MDFENLAMFTAHVDGVACMVGAAAAPSPAAAPAPADYVNNV